MEQRLEGGILRVRCDFEPITTGLEVLPQLGPGALRSAQRVLDLGLIHELSVYLHAKSTLACRRPEKAFRRIGQWIAAVIRIAPRVGVVVLFNVGVCNGGADPLMSIGR